MTAKGIVLPGPCKPNEARARSVGLAVVVDPALPLAFDKTMFVIPGTRVPWDLLPAAWHFLERWDAAVPLWRYGVTAADVGTVEERARTAAVVRDLRVLLHSVELLFVRNNEAGQALMAAYRRELGGSAAPDPKGAPGTPAVEPRLAFLRAYYQIKPRLCVLPASWMAEVQARAQKDARIFAQLPRQGGALVTVEIEPGRLVKCYRGDEEKVKAHYPELQRGRRGRPPARKEMAKRRKAPGDKMRRPAANK